MKDAFKLINHNSDEKQPSLIQRINKPQDVDPCLRTMTQLPAVSILIFLVIANRKLQINVSLHSMIICPQIGDLS